MVLWIKLRRRVFAAGTVFICAAVWISIIAGCSYFGKNEDDTVLIRVGDQTATVGDFKRAFEITKAAYSHNLLQEDAIFKEAQLRLLHQMTEELIILERAEELGIRVPDNELEKKISRIKEDYPDEVFEEILLENAVSYESWKEGLRTRLVVEKTITAEVESRVEITPEDISGYYREKRSRENSEAEEEKGENEELIVRELKRKKAEAQYQKWVKALHEKYTVEINKEAWEKIEKA